MLGCAQRALHPAVQARLGGGVPLLMRSTGGGAVWAGPWLVGVSVLLPLGDARLGAGLLSGYRWLGQLHATALGQLGVFARTLPPQAQAQANRQLGDTVDWACFGSLAPWELIDEHGRKLVGLAQRRQATGVLLVAGTLVAAPDWTPLCQALAQPQDAPALQRRIVSCEDVAGRSLRPAEVAAVLQQTLAQALA